MQSLAELPLVGGNRALDFVNTAEERGHPQAGDVLHTPDDLRAWGVLSGIVEPQATCADPAGELRRALGARELLHRIWAARVAGRLDAAEDLDALGSLAAEATTAARLRPSDDGRLRWSWDADDLASVRHVAIADAVELLARGPTDRLRRCPGEGCGWFFLDTTKRGNRRWCSMRECGQDAKSARRRERAGQV